MNKIFFFDIDGTLSIRGKMCASTKEALQQLKEKGYLVIICTGRPPFYAKKLFQGLVSGYVTCNGRCILFNNEIIFENPMTDNQIKYYLDKVSILGGGCYYNSENGIFVNNLDEKAVSFLGREYGLERVWQEKGDISYYNFDITYTSLEQRDRLIKALEDTVVVNDHGGMGSADCTLKEFDKGDAIRYLLEYFNISKENAYAFGDGMNDQAMFREVTNKIAMENAVDQLKEKASYITTSVLEDGVWNALKHLNIIE